MSVEGRGRGWGTVSFSLAPGPYKRNFTRLLVVCVMVMDGDQCNRPTVMGSRPGTPTSYSHAHLYKVSSGVPRHMGMSVSQEAC